MNSKVLILGKGYIGCSLFNQMKNASLMIVSRDYLDYHSPQILTKYLLDGGYDVVINAAGFTGRPNVDEAESKKALCWDLNVAVPLTINRVCNNLGIKYIHISSGCIYGGYTKDYTEIDNPNFGLFDDESSWYSKTKHAFELMSKQMDIKILRIRMPITPDMNPRNYLVKIKNYDNLITNVNSKTYIPDLSQFVDVLLSKESPFFWKGQDVYNVVNPKPMGVRELTGIMEVFKQNNPNWKFVEIKDLNIIAERSNCVLDTTKASHILKLRPERDIVITALTVINNER